MGSQLQNPAPSRPEHTGAPSMNSGVVHEHGHVAAHVHAEQQGGAGGRARTIGGALAQLRRGGGGGGGARTLVGRARGGGGGRRAGPVLELGGGRAHVQVQQRGTARTVLAAQLQRGRRRGVHALKNR